VKAWVVGGCVRDWILGRPFHADLDIVSESDPAPLAQACERHVKADAESFGQFGTLRVVGPKVRVDFARSRAETYPEPAALPVVSPAPIEKDLFRRDFTINAMAWPLGGGEVLDPYGGRADLAAGRLKLLHAQSFQDDPTRVFRAARFAARFGFSAEALVPDAARALRSGAAAKLSRHRVAQELWQVLEEPRPEGALERLKAWGYLSLIHPDLRWPALPPEPPEVRLGLLAVETGEDLLSALPLPRGRVAAAVEALELLRRQASPRGPLTPAARRIAELVRPGSGHEPLLVTSDDLTALGLKPGRAFGEVLEQAARQQWKGAFKTRRQALAWLRDYVK
jgi:tRNA nucleotidyltransferase/poly(A) polymerase